MALRKLIIVLILLSLLVVSGIEGCEPKEVGLEDAVSPEIFDDIKQLDPPKYTDAPFGLDPPKTEFKYGTN